MSIGPPLRGGSPTSDSSKPFQAISTDCKNRPKSLRKPHRLGLFYVSGPQANAHVRNPSASPCTRSFFANELTPAFGDATLDSNRHPSNFDSWMSRDNFVHAMRFTVRIMLRTIYFVAKPSNWYSVNRVHWRAANDRAIMVRRVTYHDDFMGHIELLPIFQ
jgi:hypothetical protein